MIIVSDYEAFGENALQFFLVETIELFLVETIELLF